MTEVDGRLGIEFISVLAMPPVPFIEFTSELGCQNIGVALAPFTPNPHGYPAWSLRDDSALRRETITALRQNGVVISLGEGFLGLPGADLADSARDLDLMAELGAKRVNVLSCDPDLSRALDQLARFADLTQERGIDATLEFIPGMPIGDLPGAMKAIAHVGKPHFRLLADLMHIFRSGATVADLAALDPATIGYIQLCDVPLVSKYDSYGTEARDERLAPGEGELPLSEALAVLPRELIVGLEVPKVTAAGAGAGPRERLASAVATTRAMLEQLV